MPEMTANSDKACSQTAYGVSDLSEGKSGGEHNHV